MLDTTTLDTTESQTPDMPHESEADAEDSTPSYALPPLYRHSKRQQWGLGVTLLELSDRAFMQFQDGQMRAMHLDYKHLLEPVDRPYDVARGLIEALEDMAPDELRPGKAKKRAVPITLKEQVGYFRELFPEGFQGTAYTEHHRGDGRKRPLKRHRDGLIERAQKTLSKGALLALRDKGGATAIHKATSKVVSLSDVVSPAGRKAFAAIEEEHHEALADSLRALLHGKSALALRFDAWVRTLEVATGKTPSWALATVLLGALTPEEHLAVKPNAVKLQAQFMAPGLRIGTRPMGILYERLQKMAADVRERMQEEGLAPRDLLDVYDFMWKTLKPAGRKRIEDIRYDMQLADIRAEQSEDTAQAA